MFGLGLPELAVISVIALIVVGRGKLPEVTGSVGKGIRELKKSMEEAGKESSAASGQEAKKVDASGETR